MITRSTCFVVLTTLVLSIRVGVAAETPDLNALLTKKLPGITNAEEAKQLSQEGYWLLYDGSDGIEDENRTALIHRKAKSKLLHALSWYKDADCCVEERTNILESLEWVDMMLSAPTEARYAWLQQALELNQKHGNRSQVAQLYSRLGWLAANEQDKAAANDYYQRAIDINITIDAPVDAADDFLSKLDMLPLEADEEKLAQLTAFQPLIEESGNAKARAMILTEIGETQTYLENFDKARAALNTATKLADESGDNELRADARLKLLDLYDASGNTDAAQKMLKDIEEMRGDLDDDFIDQALAIRDALTAITDDF